MIVVVARLLMLEFEMQLQNMEQLILLSQPGAKAAAKTTTDHLAAAELLPPLIVAVVESCLLTYIVDRYAMKHQSRSRVSASWSSKFITNSYVHLYVGPSPLPLLSLSSLHLHC